MNLIPYVFASFLLLTGTPQLIAEAPVVRTTNPVVDSKLEIWIDTLRKCESGGNDKALNPVDLDGTPSKGRFQFKDTTFYGFAKQYKIVVTDVWNGDEQELILRRMIDDPKVNIRRQFPDCTTNPKVKNFAGLPPTKLYGGDSS